MSRPNTIKDMTLAEIEDYFRSLDFGALTAEQYAQVIRIVQMSLRRFRNQIPGRYYWRRLAVGTAIHALTELEENILSWTQTNESD